MSRLLITLGLCLIALGAAWPWLKMLPLGRLPGDIHWERDGAHVYLPIATCVLLSVVASLISWWLRR